MNNAEFQLQGVGDPRLAVHATSALPAWLWSGDGMRILWTIFTLLKNEQPFVFFSLWSLVFLIASLVLAYPVVVTFLETGLVPRFPTAILATGLIILGVQQYWQDVAIGVVLVAAVYLDQFRRRGRERG